MNKDYDLIVFGASGFTGVLIAEYLSNHKDIKNIRWAIAGRNKKKLELISRKFSIDFILADSFDQESLNSMCRKSKLIISTVGPYDIYGEKLIKACVKEESHYLDLTGEPAFIQKMTYKYSASAANKDVILIHCCGFESIPADLGTYLSVKELQSNDINISYYLKTKGKISGGTWASFINAITSKQPIFHENKTTKKPKKRIKSKKLFYSDRFKKWALFFPVIDKDIVVKSSKSFKEYGENFRFNQYILFPSLFSVLLIVSSIAIIGILSRFKIFKKIFLNYLPSGQGPSKKERLNHWFKVVVVGESKSEMVSTTIRGGDPGYEETSKFISEMALCILLQSNELIKKNGFLTPVECSGDLMKNRLQNAGITIETSNVKNINEEC